MAQVALAWLRHQTVPVIPIIGARKVSQLQDNLHPGSICTPDKRFSKADRPLGFSRLAGSGRGMLLLSGILGAGSCQRGLRAADDRPRPFHLWERHLAQQHELAAANLGRRKWWR